MAQYTIAIADQDREYGKRLLLFLTRHEASRFHTVSITEQAYLEELIGSDKKQVDILLISQELYKEDEDYSGAGTVIVLADRRLPREVSKAAVVKKYQPADRLIEEILTVYRERHPQEKQVEECRGLAKVVGFYSAQTDCGKTTLAVLAARRLADKGISTLYLNFEDIPSTARYFACDSQNTMSEVLFFAREESRNFCEKIKALACTEENGRLDYYAPSPSVFDSYGTGKRGLQYMMEELKQSSGYEYVIVDFSAQCDEKTMTLLEYCDRILFLKSGPKGQWGKTTLLKKSLELAGYHGIVSKMINVYNQRDKNHLYEQGSCQYFVPYTPELSRQLQPPCSIGDDTVAGRILENIILNQK